MNHNESVLFRENVVTQLNYDIFAISESHLRPNDSITLNGYTWYGHNRTQLSINAVRGSGGVGFFIKDSVLSLFDVYELDKSYEGIFWIKLVAKQDESLQIYVCACYLTPESSCRGNVAQEFFDTLLTQVYLYSDGSPIVIAGDFNAQLGTSSDYNEILDQVPAPAVLDTDRNQQGENLRKYLKDSLQCVLNGRICPENDNFTCVSWRGRSVVDNVLVPYTCLPSVRDFSVKTVTNFIDEYSIHPPSRNVPDHSVLLCTLELSYFIVDTLTSSTVPTEQSVNETQNIDVPRRKYNVSSVPINILDSERCCSALVNVIELLQHDTDC